MHRLPSFSRTKGSAGRQWVHSSEALTSGKVTYTCKFLGHVEVDQPKGSDMVHEAIRKMKFNKQVKRAEGEKPPKVEILISIDGIVIQDPKFKMVQYQYPLHHVSYCADDKSDKRMFTFIAKDKDTEKHHCFVFDSEKCAEEITLTLGQAFELAYHRFLDSTNKNIDVKKQMLLLQKKVTDLMQENNALKDRVAMLEALIEQKKQNEAFTSEVKTDSRSLQRSMSLSARSPNGGSVIPPPLAPPPPVPSRSHIPPQLSSTSEVHQGHSVDIFGSTPFTAHQSLSSSSSSVPPPPASRPSLSSAVSLVSPISSPVTNFSFTPTPSSTFAFSPSLVFSPVITDAFGMQTFSPTTSSFDWGQQTDQELMDMQVNFSRGLSIGTEDFSLEDLDPVRK